MPLTAVAMATSFSSSTSSCSPRLPSRTRAWSRCVAVTSGVGVPDGHALAQLSRSVGHAAHELPMAERVGQGRCCGAGDDADHELAVVQLAAQLAPDPDKHLWLDGEDDHVRARRPPATLSATVPMPYCCSSSLRRSARGWLATIWLRRDLLAAQQPRDHCLGHHARADGCDAGRHRATWRRSLARLGRWRCPRRKKRAVVVTLAVAKPAARALPPSRAGSQKTLTIVNSRPSSRRRS